jgi:hypothetical protein
MQLFTLTFPLVSGKDIAGRSAGKDLLNIDPKYLLP